MQTLFNSKKATWSEQALLTNIVAVPLSSLFRRLSKVDTRIIFGHIQTAHLKCIALGLFAHENKKCRNTTKRKLAI